MLSYLNCKRILDLFVIASRQSGLKNVDTRNVERRQPCIQGEAVLKLEHVFDSRQMGVLAI